MHHAAAAAELDGLGEGAVRTAVGFPGADVKGLTHLAAVDDLQGLAECRSKEPVFRVVNVLAQTLGGVNHILCVFHGGGQGLFADDIVTCLEHLMCWYHRQ